MNGWLALEDLNDNWCSVHSQSVVCGVYVYVYIYLSYIYNIYINICCRSYVIAICKPPSILRGHAAVHIYPLYGRFNCVCVCVGGGRRPSPQPQRWRRHLLRILSGSFQLPWLLRLQHPQLLSGGMFWKTHVRLCIYIIYTSQCTFIYIYNIYIYIYI